MVAVACQVAVALSPAARVSSSRWATSSSSSAPAVLVQSTATSSSWAKCSGVRRGQRGQQAPLVGRRSRAARPPRRCPGRGELAPRLGVPDRRSSAPAWSALPAAAATLIRPRTSVPSMVKKRRVGVLDRAGVGAVGRDLAEPVEQRLARHPHVVEPDPPVVDAVEAGLGPAVLDP